MLRKIFLMTEIKITDNVKKKKDQSLTRLALTHLWDVNSGLVISILHLERINVNILLGCYV